MITFFTLGVSMVIAFVATAPDFPVLALTIGFVVGAIVVPLVAFPFTNTLWMAFDLLSKKPRQRWPSRPDPLRSLAARRRG